MSADSWEVAIAIIMFVAVGGVAAAWYYDR